MTQRRRIQAATLGIAILLVGIVGFGLLSRPPAPAPSVDIVSLDQAVGVGLLDAEVLAELRATGAARAVLHLNTALILEPIRRAIGADRTTALIDAMVAAFKANKATLNATFGTDVELVRDFERVGAVIVTVRSEDALLRLLRSRLVSAVGGDVQVPLERGSAGSPVAGLAAAAPSIYEGAGVAIGVLDTGVDFQRYPDYFPVGSVVQTLEAAAEDGSADDDGHGTHVSSTVLLMAPQAQLYVSDVFRQVLIDGQLEPRAYNSDLLAGMDWLIGLKRAGVNLRAVNLSLGWGHFPPNICVDRFHLAEALAAGIIPVASAGNAAFEDDEGNPLPTWQAGLGSTGCNESALSVGAVSNGSCADGSVDQVATFSQSGPGLDILAPGMCIVAAGGSLNGTSMAAPHVSGAVAVLASAKPSASIDEIWSTLVSNGPEIVDPNSGIARNRLDIPAAVDALLGVAVPRPTPEPVVVRGVALGVTSISPNEALEPGRALELEPVAVRNVGNVEADYVVTVEAPSGGFLSPAPASWFTVSPTELALAADAIGEVRIQVRPPDGTRAGVYSAELRVADASGDPTAVGVVNLSLVVFSGAVGAPSDDPGGPVPGGPGDPGGPGGSTGSSLADDLGELIENPVVIIVGLVLVVWAMRRLLGGSRKTT